MTLPTSMKLHRTGVVKPWPSAQFESLPGGLGVMADDGMAAIYGNLIMWGLIALAPAGWLT